MRFWVLVGEYKDFSTSLMCFQRKVYWKKLFRDSTYSGQNVDYRVLWVLVNTTWGVCVDYK